MYLAKRKGAAETEIFSPQMRSQAKTTMETKNKLSLALERTSSASFSSRCTAAPSSPKAPNPQEFVLHYQPVFGLKNEDASGI